VVAARWTFFRKVPGFEDIYSEIRSDTFGQPEKKVTEKRAGRTTTNHRDRGTIVQGETSGNIFSSWR
jgi:hypothetical protein